MKQNKIVLIALIIIIGYFFWDQIRPSMIKKECYSRATALADEQYSGKYRENFEYHFKQCLRYKGLSY